jgi:hypothetical protein
LGVKAPHFSMAFFFVSGLIQARFSMRTFRAALRFCTSSCMRALDSGGNATST